MKHDLYFSSFQWSFGGDLATLHREIEYKVLRLFRKRLYPGPVEPMLGLGNHTSYNGGQKSLERLWKTFLPHP